MSRDGAKDKRIAATTNDADDDLKKPTPPPPHNNNFNKISRKEKMRDKQNDVSYQPRSLRKQLERAKKNNFDPDLLKISADDFKTLPMETKVRWLTAHFLLRRDAYFFKRCDLTEDEDSSSSSEEEE